MITRVRELLQQCSLVDFISENTEILENAEGQQALRDRFETRKKTAVPRCSRVLGVLAGKSIRTTLTFRRVANQTVPEIDQLLPVESERIARRSTQRLSRRRKLLTLDPSREISCDRSPVRSLHVGSGSRKRTCALPKRIHLQLDKRANFRRCFLVGREQQQPIGDSTLRNTTKRRSLA